MTERLYVELESMRVGDHDAPAPANQSADAAGMDLHAALAAEIVILPGKRALVGTGWAFAIPPGFEGQVRPRSGLAHKHGITVLNTPGTVDADYRGEVKVVLQNFGDDPFTVRPGDRIAQLVIAPVAKATLHVATSLDSTERGAGGYGSTGVASATARRV